MRKDSRNCAASKEFSDSGEDSHAKNVPHRADREGTIANGSDSGASKPFASKIR